METWRLSRIEDELEKLDFTQDPADSLSSSIFNSLSGDLGFTFSNIPGVGNKNQTDDEISKVDEGYSEDDDEEEENTINEDYLPPPPDELLYPVEDDPDLQDGQMVKQNHSRYEDLYIKGKNPFEYNRNVTLSKEEDIYSEAVIKPVHSNKFTLQHSPEERTSSDAVKHFTDKYDSLNRMKMSQFPSIIPPGYVSTQKNSLSRSSESILKDLPPFDDVSSSGSNSRRKSSENILSDVWSSPHKLPPSTLGTSRLEECSDVPSWKESQENIEESKDHSSLSVVSKPIANQCLRPNPVPSLTEQELLQVEMFYRSHKTQVFVCHCVAELHFGSVRNSKTFDNFYSDSNNTSGWSLVQTGIPALVLDKVERKLQLLLTERGTGFTLWKEIISYKTNYSAVQPNFHTLHLMNDTTKLVGLSFQDSVGASEFLQHYISVISCPEDDILNIGKKAKSKKKKDKKAKPKKPTSKADISAPCCFTHITALDRNDGLDVTEKIQENVS